jgi:hypothetical protein
MFENLGKKLIGCAAFYMSVSTVVLTIFLVSRSVGVSFYELTKDPIAGMVDSIPFYTSILSNLGIVFWCFTAAVQFFAAWILRRADSGSPESGFLFWSGLLTLVLMLDDFLLMHERLGHTIESVIFATYGILVAIISLAYRQLIFRTNYLVLVAALGFFMMSMVLDNVLTQIGIDIPYRTTLEDAFKVIGIVGWSYYFVGFATMCVRQVVPRDERG